MKTTSTFFLTTAIVFSSLLNVKAQNNSGTVVLTENKREETAAVIASPESKMEAILADQIFDADLSAKQDKVTIELKQMMTSFEVRIYNPEGKKMLSLNEYGQNTIEVPVQNFSAGIYTVEIKTNDNSFFKKIVKN